MAGAYLEHHPAHGGGHWVLSPSSLASYWVYGRDLGGEPYY